MQVLVSRSGNLLRYSELTGALDSPGRKDASTSFTPNFSHTNPSLITWSHSKSKRRSIRSGGVSVRTQRTSCCQQMVRALWSTLLPYGVPYCTQSISYSRLSPHMGSLPNPDKTIKLWKVFEKSLKVVAENNHISTTFQPVASAPAELKLPRMAFHDTIIAAVPRKVYANAHAYHINSISINSDGETYMSADDLRINLWNLAISEQSFSQNCPFIFYLNSLSHSLCTKPRADWSCDGKVCHRLFMLMFAMLFSLLHLEYNHCRFCGQHQIDILDIKPANMEELTEVITAAEFHPLSCNLFCYSSSKGTVKLADMRSSALCDTHAKRRSFSDHDPVLSKLTKILRSGLASWPLPMKLYRS